MFLRDAKVAWTLMASLGLVLVGAGLFIFPDAGLWLGFSHLEPVDVANVTAGTPSPSGIPTPISGAIVEGGTGLFQPHFPYSDFLEARAHAKNSCFQFMVKEKLPEGTYWISVSNSLGKVVVPLEKKAPNIYVSTPLIVLDPHAYTTYFIGYGVLFQEAGTQDKLNIQVEKTVAGPKKNR